MQYPQVTVQTPTVGSANPILPFVQLTPPRRPASAVKNADLIAVNGLVHHVETVGVVSDIMRRLNPPPTVVGHILADFGHPLDIFFPR